MWLSDDSYHFVSVEGSVTTLEFLQNLCFGGESWPTLHVKYCLRGDQVVLLPPILVNIREGILIFDL